MKAMYGVVLYTEGMAICEDDWEDLWCAEMPEEFVTEGDGIEIDGLTPLGLPRREGSVAALSPTQSLQICV